MNTLSHRAVARPGRIVGTGTCQECYTPRLLWHVADDGSRPQLLDPATRQPHGPLCPGPRAKLVVPPSEDEALHAAHTLRDYLKGVRAGLAGDQRQAADRAFDGAVAWVACLPAGPAACPICSRPVRDGRR